MFHLYLLTSLAFGPAVLALDAPAFADRELASATLRRHLPLTAPLVHVAATTTPSPEVRSRCESLLARYDFVYRVYRLDAAYQELIDDPEECDGLPWLSRTKYEALIWEPTFRAWMQLQVKKYRDDKKLFGRVTFYCEPTPIPDTFQGEGYASGLQSIRFVARGLPEPVFSRVTTADLRKQWAELKARVPTPRR